MVIKPLEKDDKRENRRLGIKIGFLIILLAAGFVLSKLIPKNTNKDNNDVLGTTQENSNDNKLPVTEKAAQFIQNTTDSLINNAIDSVTSLASQSAATVTDTVFTNTVVNAVKQIDKLPTQQQEEIRQAICH